MPDLLNPVLYRRLKRAFKHDPKLTSEGEAMVYEKRRDIYLPGEKFHYDFIQGGEYYRVCCPYCYDTRYRLYVSHMFGKKDRDGVPMTFLAVCYNENCLENWEHRRHFLDALRHWDGLSDADIGRGITLTDEQLVFDWPGPVTRIDQLPDDHDAVAYVRGRGFSTEILGRYYGVAYCHHSVHFYAAKRLIVPVYADGEMKGWQARYVGELRWKNKDKQDSLPPKYYTCPRMKRSKLIGNFDNARKYKTMVLVEGWFDVFACGPWTGCIFGNFTSAYQRRMLIEEAKANGQSVVFMLDPEEFESESSVLAMSELARELPAKFAAVKLPAGTDPGALGRPFLLDYITASAAEQGVEVAFAKRGA